MGREGGCCTSPDDCNAHLPLGHREPIFFPFEQGCAFLLGWFMCASIHLSLAMEFSTYWTLLAELGGGEEASSAALLSFVVKDTSASGLFL